MLKREDKRSLIAVGVSYLLCLLVHFLWYAVGNSFGILSKWWQKLIWSTDLFYILIWIIPAFICVLLFSRNLKVSFENLFLGNIKPLRLFLTISAFFAYAVIIQVLNHGWDFGNISLSYQEVIFAIAAGVCEEFIFRGWFQNILDNIFSGFISSMITAIMFLLFHFPGWIFTGAFASSILSGGLIILPVLSFIFSGSFRRNGNLISPIIIHIVWDLLMYAII